MLEPTSSHQERPHVTASHADQAIDGFVNKLGGEPFSVEAVLLVWLDERGITDGLLRDEAQGSLDTLFAGASVDPDSPTGQLVIELHQAWVKRFGPNPVSDQSMTIEQFENLAG